MDATNPFLFLLTINKDIDFVNRIYNHKGHDWLTIDDSDYPIKTPINWEILEDIFGKDCNKSISIHNLVVPSLPSDINAKAIFIDKYFQCYKYDTVCGLSCLDSVNWSDSTGSRWNLCFKVLPDVKKSPRLPIAKPSDNLSPSDYEFLNPKTLGAYTPPSPNSKAKSWDDPGDWVKPNPNAGYMWAAAMQEMIKNDLPKHADVAAEDTRHRDLYIDNQFADFYREQDRFEDHDTNQRVELISKASDYEDGWFGTWPEELEIGHVFRFFGLHGSRGIKVISCENFHTYFLPYFVLATVEEE